ncbi:uncharacterized protein I206_102970 [Kwoniella pini CBS 10737]|uniref:Uncharacterized protein n=1 Tax=Kwoniella pini CBS 10737 TaxID=1296096 RepID=A0A1B9I6Y8_9TREE|nr:uncharacterized protein I206_03323 [Kwoniella pini CBS 10737]OCF51256.1 hypothetical protein I206_03323 [Kwoniella pini CBS 10737]
MLNNTRIFDRLRKTTRSEASRDEDTDTRVALSYLYDFAQRQMRYAESIGREMNTSAAIKGKTVKIRKNPSRPENPTEARETFVSTFGRSGAQTLRRVEESIHKDPHNTKFDLTDNPFRTTLAKYFTQDSEAAQSGKEHLIEYVSFMRQFKPVTAKDYDQGEELAEDRDTIDEPTKWTKFRKSFTSTHNGMGKLGRDFLQNYERHIRSDKANFTILKDTTKAKEYLRKGKWKQFNAIETRLNENTDELGQYLVYLAKVEEKRKSNKIEDSEKLISEEGIPTQYEAAAPSVGETSTAKDAAGSTASSKKRPRETTPEANENYIAVRTLSSDQLEPAVPFTEATETAISSSPQANVADSAGEDESGTEEGVIVQDSEEEIDTHLSNEELERHRRLLFGV